MQTLKERALAAFAERERIQAEQAAQAEREAAVKGAARLKALLNKTFGIDADPTENRWTVDGVTFGSISRHSYNMLHVIHLCPDCGEDLYDSQGVWDWASLGCALKNIETNPKDSLLEHYCPAPAPIEQTPPPSSSHAERAANLIDQSGQFEWGASEFLQAATAHALLSIQESLTDQPE